MLKLQRKSAEALEVFGELDKVIANWEPIRRQVFEINGARIYSLYSGGQIEAGLSAAQALLKREIGRVGERHFDTAAARGTLAVGLMKAGKNTDAAREFRAAIPVLMPRARENADDDDTTLVAAKRAVACRTLLKPIWRCSPAGQCERCLRETFALAEAIRGRSGAAGACGFQRADAREGFGTGGRCPSGTGPRKTGQCATGDAQQRTLHSRRMSGMRKV